MVWWLRVPGAFAVPSSIPSIHVGWLMGELTPGESPMLGLLPPQAPALTVTYQVHLASERDSLFILTVST